MRWKVFRDSSDKGYDFKQSIANVMAGDYDEEKARKEVEELMVSAPCVVFAWEASPSCKKAFEALDKAGAQYKVVRLDDPWDEGNTLRAEIGKMVGRSSVPAIFIGGKYVGGYDGGVSDEAPGILDMAFKGTLRPMLEEVGALPLSDGTAKVIKEEKKEEATAVVEAKIEAEDSSDSTITDIGEEENSEEVVMEEEMSDIAETSEVVEEVIEEIVMEEEMSDIAETSEVEGSSDSTAETIEEVAVEKEISVETEAKEEVEDYWTVQKSFAPRS